jgi:hypothetical protein
MMPFSTTPHVDMGLPELDERLVAPESGYEIEDGRVVYAAPADEPHAEIHVGLSALVQAHCASSYSVALDMLTRTSRIDDIAPAVSVYPTARDPRTGGRQLEELAFEIASTESVGHAGSQATKLIARGVRRVFAIDVGQLRALEWSKELGWWSILDRRGRIEDRALAVPIPIAAVPDVSLVDDAIVRAWRAKRHPEFIAEREEGRMEGEAAGKADGLAKVLLAVLGARGLEPTEDEHRRLLAERDLGRLERWLAAAGTCSDLAGLLALP